MNKHIEMKRSCPACGGSDWVQESRPQTVSYGGLESPPYEQPGLWCRLCGEGLLSFKEMEVGTREMHKLKARVEHLLEPGEVKRVRKKLGLTQKDAGLILGGGPNAFQKYESAEVVTSQAISNLLRVLDHDPSALEVLRREVRRRAAQSASSVPAQG